MSEFEIVNRKTGELTEFDPSKTADYLLGLEAVKKRAIRMKDWPTLAIAISEEVQLQREHCSWWKGAVRGPGRHGNSARPGTISERDAIKTTSITAEQTSKWAAKLQDAEKYEAQLEAKARKAAGLEPADNHRSEGTGEPEWYTPALYIEAARQVLGAIDLDPASSDIAQKTVKASEYFTAQRSSLNVPWHGRVWLNPPFSQPAIQHFAEKTVLEATEGRIDQAIVLTHNYTDTFWFHHIEEVAARICFTRGRIAFLNPQGEKCAPTQGQAFFYIGENAQAFDEVFRQFGFVR